MDQPFEIAAEQQKQFQLLLKIGILKQLHAENMLSDAQLSYALRKISAQREELPQPAHPRPVT